MSRQRSNQKAGKASIIQEIVIYNKPNKPPVSQDILPEQPDVGEADIVLSFTETSTLTKLKNSKSQLVEEVAPTSIKQELTESDVKTVTEEKATESTSKAVCNKKKLTKSDDRGKFKKPRGRPRKQIGDWVLRNATLLDFVERKPKATEDNSIADSPKDNISTANCSENEASPDNGKVETRQKRVRKIPERYKEDTPITAKDNNVQEARGKKRGRKKKEASNSNTPVIKQEPNIKQEVENENDEDEELPETSREEEYDSDEDSRSEWVPEEYVQYKRQHIMKLINKMHKCKFCNAEFATYYGVRKHRAMEHNDLGRSLKEAEYNSQEGGGGGGDQDESDEEERGEWMPGDYAQYKLKHSLNKMKRSQWYKCKICCEVFPNYYKLSKHRVGHENKANPYECKECSAKFSEVEDLTAHIRIHQGKDPYQCRRCEKSLLTKEELNEHMNVHVLKKGPMAVKRFRCDLCGKEFCKLADIERHTRVHTGEKPCECTICHRRFQQQHNLSKHLLIHLQVKPFQCEICNKKFGRVDVLNRHILVHSVEKPFKCVFCGKGFIRQVQLTNHMNKFHPDEDISMLSRVTDEVIVTPVN